MIKLYIDDACFEIPEGTLAKAIADAIPDFVKHETVPAPTDLADVMRTALVGATSFFMNDLLFYVYGANAPKIPLRADKLPYLSMAFIDMIVGTLKRYKVTIHAKDTDEDGVFLVTEYSAVALQPGSAPAVSATGGCADCPGAAQGTADQRGGTASPGDAQSDAKQAAQ